MASKWLPGYTYDASSGRYRRADTGRFVKRDTITDLLETSISQRARDIRRGFEAVLNEELGVTPWLHRTAQQLKREHLELAALAAGGWDRLTPADYARIEGRLNFDFKHLANMAREISEGAVSLAQGLNRLDMYLGSARREYLDVEKNGRLARVKDGYALIAKRHLAPHAIHCASCEEYALWPWRPADVVPVPTEACLCGNACRCDIEYKETALTYMEAVAAEFNPHHDALGRFATGPGMMAPDTGGGGGGLALKMGARTVSAAMAQDSISSGDILNHIVKTNPPDQISSGRMTPAEWADKYMSDEPKGYVLIDVSPQVMNLPVAAGLPEKVERFALERGESAPPVVVDSNEKIEARWGGGKMDQAYGLQPHTVLDGKHRVEAALARGDVVIKAYVPKRKAEMIIKASRDIERQSFAMDYFSRKGYPVVRQRGTDFDVMRQGSPRTFTRYDIEKIAANTGHEWHWPNE